jgi:hypothetical protein
MNNQDLAELEMRRKVGELWDKVVDLGRLVEHRQQILELTRTMLEWDCVPAVEEAELEQAEREQACAWIQYLDLNRKVYIST